MSQNIRKDTLRVIPSGTAGTTLPVKADQNKGLLIAINGVKAAPERDPLIRTQGVKTNTSTAADSLKILGVLLEYNNDEAMTIGTKGIYRVMADSATSPSGTHIGQTITGSAATGKEGQALPHATNGIGRILDVWPWTSPTHYIVELNLPQNK